MSAIIQTKTLGFPWQTQDPFLFCVHHLDAFPPGQPDMSPEPGLLQGRNIGNDFTIKDGWRMYHGRRFSGFPYHPHRGFETITINKQGVVDHSDSLGAAGCFMAGDVQWMTAGKGVLHSEMFPLLQPDAPNTMEIFQIWINLPRASKMVDPHFKMLWKEAIPQKEWVDGEGRKTVAEVIAGELDGTRAPAPTPSSWAADPANGVGVYTIRMDARARWVLPPTSATSRRSLYFYRGTQLELDGQTMSQGRLAELKPELPVAIQNGEGEAYLLVLEGKPIGEPVVQHGPFVMNTEDEIRQAFADYQRTQFGGWPWPEQEQVHAKTKGRFALHADGREETP